MEMDATGTLDMVNKCNRLNIDPEKCNKSYEPCDVNQIDGLDIGSGNKCNINNKFWSAIPCKYNYDQKICENILSDVEYYEDDGINISYKSQ